MGGFLGWEAVFDEDCLTSLWVDNGLIVGGTFGYDERPFLTLPGEELMVSIRIIRRNIQIWNPGLSKH